MIIDDVDIDNLPDAPEEAFLAFESQLRQGFNNVRNYDREHSTDHNGNYYGNYEPERQYVSSLIAFIHEMELDIIFSSDPPENDSEFITYFASFFSDINYARTRLKMRLKKNKTFVGTTILLQENYKSEITGYLNTIKKIVTSNIEDENKKDLILKKINNLQFEIDRNRTTLDTVFDRFIDLSKTIGKAGDNLEPAIERLERVMKAITSGAEKPKLLEKPNKQITDETKKNDLEDEIPF